MLKSFSKSPSFASVSPLITVVQIFMYEFGILYDDEDDNVVILYFRVLLQSVNAFLPFQYENFESLKLLITKIVKS